MTTEDVRAWRCIICGYIHRGSEPPESCPICGAPRNDFDPYHEAAAAGTERTISRWRCLDCGYVHEGAAPPDECPVCGAAADRFEPISEEAAPVVASSDATKVVVVGAGIAGVAAVEALRATSATVDITLISEENYLPYYRLNLTRYLAGEIMEADKYETVNVGANSIILMGLNQMDNGTIILATWRVEFPAGTRNIRFEPGRGGLFCGCFLRS